MKAIAFAGCGVACVVVVAAAAADDDDDDVVDVVANVDAAGVDMALVEVAAGIVNEPKVACGCCCATDVDSVLKAG